MTRYDMDRLYEHLRKEGIKVDESMKRVISYFNGQVLVSFCPSVGCASRPNEEYDDKISKELHMDKEVVSTRRMQLERLHILGHEKGAKSIGGREFEFGLTEKAKDILEGMVCSA